MQIATPFMLVAGLALAACQPRTADDKFLDQPISEQIAQARSMPTADVYRIYKRALVIRPGTRSLAEVLSERGGEAASLVLMDLDQGSSFIYPSHYLPILEGLCTKNTACYCTNQQMKGRLVEALRKHDGYQSLTVEKLDAGETEFGAACRYYRNSNP